MNIQIFGTKKCNDTKKAQRFFKERGIKFQFVDLKQRNISPGELRSIKQALGGMEQLIDWNSKDKDALARYKYMENQREETLLDNPQILDTPIVRNGQKVTIGHGETTWKSWIEEE